MADDAELPKGTDFINQALENESSRGNKQPYLVGGIPTPLKNMKVNGKDDIPCIKWKTIEMF